MRVGTGDGVGVVVTIPSPSSPPPPLHPEMPSATAIPSTAPHPVPDCMFVPHSRHAAKARPVASQSIPPPVRIIDLMIGGAARSDYVERLRPYSQRCTRLRSVGAGDDPVLPPARIRSSEPSDRATHFLRTASSSLPVVRQGSCLSQCQPWHQAQCYVFPLLLSTVWHKCYRCRPYNRRSNYLLAGWHADRGLLPDSISTHRGPLSVKGESHNFKLRAAQRTSSIIE